MQTAATRYAQCRLELLLHMAFELAEKEWKLGFTVGFGQRPRVGMIPARDVKVLEWEIHRAKKRFDLPEAAQVRKSLLPQQKRNYLA
jgi:hypothetical protein